MKLRYIITTIASITAVNFASAQVMPEQAPLNTTIGGSGASNQALVQLGKAAGEIKMLGNLEGPSEGRDTERTSVNQYPIPAAELAGIEGYYLRSSYVTLGPKGFAPLHSHVERPAFLQVVSGTIHQHRSDGISFVMGEGDFTFSSDGLAHWWSNDSADDPITLWIVELCTEAHKCDSEIRDGAIPVPASSNAQEITGPAPMMSIDLAGEFPTADGFGERQLNLRRHDIPAGQSFDLATLGSSLTHIRVFSGELVAEDDGTSIDEGSVYIINEGANGNWSNKTDAPATLYSVEFERQ